MQQIEILLERIVKRLVKTPDVAGFLQDVFIHPRFELHLIKSRLAYQRFSDDYKHHIIFIAGLPKSGTTWLDQMLSDMPGFSSTILPGMHWEGRRFGGGHNYDFSEKEMNRFDKTLSIIKTHSYGSKNNAELLARHGIKYIVMYRDIRDIAVSYVHFVRERPWHSDYRNYMDCSIQDGLMLFARKMSIPFSDWIRLWEINRDHTASLIVKYEDLVRNPSGIFSDVLTHYEIAQTDEDYSKLVESFLNSEQRKGVTHFRKGIIGDWRNHFTYEIKNAFKETIGQFLIEYGYEKDNNW